MNDMKRNDEHHQNSQPLRELEWLIHYFQQHGREDLAQDIYQDLTFLRKKAQDSLESEQASEVLDFDQRDRRLEG